MRIEGKEYRTIWFEDNIVNIIDQTKLPLKEDYIETDDYRIVCDAIYALSIRGAPAIGVAGAYACVLAANKINYKDKNKFIENFLIKAQEIEETRPTAINLSWAVKQMKDRATSFSGNLNSLKSNLLELANEIKSDDISRCHKLSLHGSKLISDVINV